MRTTLLSLAALLLFHALMMGQTTPQDQYTLKGPFTYKNLTLFIVSGKDQTPGKTYLTLEEAIKQQKIKVYETGSVNQLQVENLSQTEDIFIQAGEIVKGGRQDRTLQNDMILSAKSGKVPLPSFCVESGRWSGRTGEASGVFNSSTKTLSGKKLKLAARAEKNQSQVWANVKATQDSLSKNLSQTVTNPASETSLQLTLENKKVEQSIDEYYAALKDAIKDNPEAIGFAFVLNGEINSADIYGNHNLFVKLWDKLLKSAATEALAEQSKSTATPAKVVSTGDIQSFMNDAESARDTKKQNNASAVTTEKESDGSYNFTTDDERTKTAVRKNYLKK